MKQLGVVVGPGAIGNVLQPTLHGDGEQIAPRTEPAGDLQTAGPVGVGVPADLFAVQADDRLIIEPLEHQPGRKVQRSPASSANQRR